MSTQIETSSAARPSNPIRRASSRHSSTQKKAWQQHLNRRASFRSGHSKARIDPEEEQRLSREISRRSTRSKRRTPKWWKIRLFRGMIDDVKRRAPYYLSDWTDAWDYRVVPATVYMYFANQILLNLSAVLEDETYLNDSILPALAFSLDMFVKTDNSYGVNEVLLASVLGCVVFSLLAAQPLVIVGVTGPITVFSYTVFDIVTTNGTNFFAFMAWIGIWALVMHWILAITNSCNGLRYITRFSCDIFGFYVAFIYLQKGIQVLTRQWNEKQGGSPQAAYLSITVALLVLVVAYGCGIIGESKLLPRQLRKFIEDYGTPLTIVFFTGFVHIGHMKSVHLETLPTSKAFFPTTNRSWLVDFWDIKVGEVFLAIPFAVLLTVLFWFDHNVSSLIAQGTEFPLRKPPGFHWDIFLLGLTTFIAGILGIPFPNGLIPQAPFHTTSLCVSRQVADTDEAAKGKVSRVVDHVVEQRVSNLAQGLLFLVTMTGPLLIVLHLIPQGILAGLFFVMGAQALAGNGVILKILYLARDRELTDKSDPLARLDRQGAVWAFVGIELLGFAATFAITQTIAAIGFPIIIAALIPLRTFLMPRWFRDAELRALDAPTAGAFVMASVGGAYGEHRDGDETPVDEGLRSPAESGGNGFQGLDDFEDGDDIAVMEEGDVAERGESYELRSGKNVGRTRASGSGSHSQMQKPRVDGVRRRSLSTRGRSSGEVTR